MVGVVIRLVSKFKINQSSQLSVISMETQGLLCPSPPLPDLNGWSPGSLCLQFPSHRN